MSTSYTMKRHIIVISIILAFVVIMSTEAQAIIYSFEAVYPINSSSYANQIAAQLSVELTNPGTTIEIDGVHYNQTLFTFKNTGNVASFIADVYFDDGELFKVADIIDGPGVLFENPASPGNLPNGNNVDPPFVASNEFSADFSGSDNGVHNFTKAIDEDEEYVGIMFALQSGKNYWDVIDAINVGFNPDIYASYNEDTKEWIWSETNLRIGIHAQGFPDGESDSFIMTPIPASVIIGLLGMGVAGIKLRKFA